MNNLALDGEDVSRFVSWVFNPKELIDHNLMLRILSEDRECDSCEQLVCRGLGILTFQLVIRSVF
jgi:hypothetical protein